MKRALLINFLIMDWGSIGASLGSSLIQSGGNNFMTYGFNKKYFNYTLPKLQDAQYNMIRNSPSLMVQGMKNAGLNPANIDSGYQGSVSAPSGNSGVQSNWDPVGKYMQIKQIQQQQDLTDANVNKLNAEAEKAKAETNEIHENAQQQRSLQASQERVNNVVAASTDQQMKNDMQRLQNETQLTWSKIGEIEQHIQNLNTENLINIKNFDYMDQMLAAQIYNLQSSGKLNNANAAKAYSDIQVNDANMKLIAEKVHLTQNEADQVSAYTSLLHENTSREHFDNQVRLMVGYDKYKQLEDNKMLGVMYDNALTIQKIKNGEVDRRVTALSGAVDNVLKVATFGVSNLAPKLIGQNVTRINYDSKGDYSGHTETYTRSQF